MKSFMDSQGVLPKNTEDLFGRFRQARLLLPPLRKDDRCLMLITFQPRVFFPRHRLTAIKSVTVSHGWRMPCRVSGLSLAKIKICP